VARVPSLDLFFPQCRNWFREEGPGVRVKPAPEGLGRQFLLGCVAEVFHHVVGKSGWVADRSAMMRHVPAGQGVAPQLANESRRQICIDTHRDMGVPVSLAPLVHGEILETRPETVEPITQPPQKLADGQRELPIRDYAKNRQPDFVRRRKLPKAAAQAECHLPRPNIPTFERATGPTARLPDGFASPCGDDRAGLPAGAGREGIFAS